MSNKDIDTKNIPLRVRLKQTFCIHDYELYGQKSPVMIDKFGKKKIGTTYYLHCNKCGKYTTNTVDFIADEI